MTSLFLKVRKKSITKCLLILVWKWSRAAKKIPRLGTGRSTYVSTGTAKGLKKLGCSIKYQYVLQATRSFWRKIHILLYCLPKSGGACAPFAPPVPPPSLTQIMKLQFFTILRLWLHFQLLTSEHSAVSRWESIFQHQTLFEVEFNILFTLVFTKTKS